MQLTPEEQARKREALRRFRGRVERDLEAVAIDLAGVEEADLDLTGAWLDRADLRHAKLLRCDLRSASLRAARLDHADLTRTDLAGATLADAQMPWAVLTRASLWGADLRNADLSHADLTDCELVNADLSGARLTEALGEPGDAANCRMDHRTYFASGWTVDDVIRWRQRGARFTDLERLPAAVRALWKHLSKQPFVHLRVEDSAGVLTFARIRDRVRELLGPLTRLVATVDVRGEREHMTRVHLSGERYERLVDFAVRLARVLPPDAIRLVSTGLSPYDDLLDYFESELSARRSNPAHELPVSAPDDWRSPLHHLLRQLCREDAERLRSLVRELQPHLANCDYTMLLPQGDASWLAIVDNLLLQLEQKHGVEEWCKQMATHYKETRLAVDSVLKAWARATSTMSHR